MKKLAAGLAVVVALAIGGGALAATGNERIYACVNNSNGEMRLSNQSAECPSGYVSGSTWRKISWSAENAPAQTIPVTTTYTKADLFDVPGPSHLVSNTVNCNEGDVATGGGSARTPSVEVVNDQPTTVPTGTTEKPVGWTIEVFKESLISTQYTIYVVCQHTA